MPDQQQRPHLVTDRDLDNALSKYPTKWEVRFLIISGLVATQLIPARDVAQAAIHVLS